MIAEKLAAALQGLTVNLNEFRSDVDKKEEKQLEKCRRMMDSSKINSSTHSTWIIDGITCQAEIDFFQTYFSNRLVLCRRQTIKSDDELAFNINTTWFFTFSTIGEENLDEQIKNFSKLIVHQ